MKQLLTPTAALPALQLSAGDPGWTLEKKRHFCAILAESGLVEHAAQAVGMSRQSAYQLRNKADGKVFALAWEAAMLLARQRLIDEAVALVREGTIEQIIRDGKVIAEKRKRDPMALLDVAERLAKRELLGKSANWRTVERFGECLDRLGDGGNFDPTRGRF
ncbi:MAG: hypothetical protein RL367_300 [Pseudomonadota bacterium]|jgi:hypothetical protein